jgi:hypothetical protein
VCRGVEVQRDIFGFRDGKVGKVDEFTVEVTFADFETDFGPVFDVVVFAMEEAVHEFELAIDGMAFIKVSL